MKSLIEKLTEELVKLRKRYPVQSHIRCQICGKWFGSLTGHLRRHSITGADYKKEYEVLTVVSDETRQKLTRGKEVISEAERVWLLKYWKDIVLTHRPGEVCKILGISRALFNKWCRMLTFIQPPAPKRAILLKAEVIARLQERAQTGKSLRVSVIRRESPQLYPAARRYFGGLNTALKEAGLEKYIVYQKRWSPDIVIKSLQERAQAGKSLRYGAIREDDLALAMAVEHYFKSWNTALGKAGLSAHIIRQPRWTPELLIETLQQRAREGKSLNFAAVHHESSKLRLAVWRHFGSWNTALKKAGLEKYIISKSGVSRI